MDQQKQSLAGSWQFRQVGETEWLPAVVPGGVHTDLLSAGKIVDPFAGQNESQAAWVAQRDWEYQRSFSLDRALEPDERIELVCEGLDTLAKVFINDILVFSTDNMFRTYHWNVRDCLEPEENQIRIVFRSPVEYIATRQKARRIPSGSNPGMPHLRKTQSHFGWDWGPSLPAVGIWRDIYLTRHAHAQLSDVIIRQAHEAGQVSVSVDTSCDYWTANPLTLSVELTAPDGEIISAAAPYTDAGANLPFRIHEGCASLNVTVARPQLWWPNGMGAQPLYHLRVRILDGELTLDERQVQIGLRTVELRRQPDEWGESFLFVINNQPVFARGANWIPADSFPARISAQQYEGLVRSAAEANMNMLRVWGGGFYESEHFYDLCDRYGILVWQDFMFACATYPLDEPGFLNSVRLEVEAAVRRLRHRACLALWCGNNEIEVLWCGLHPGADLTEAFKHFFYADLPSQVKALDPDHAYWASSPSSGECFNKPNSDASGDTHLWDVWHGMSPLSQYQAHYSRFVSEFGMQSLPDMPTIAQFLQESEYRLDAPALLSHQKSAAGTEKIFYYLTERFHAPKHFPDLVYLSQIVQAEAIRIGVEHWRRNYPRCAGALYWQLNDCWPGLSWSSIDYAGRWKALQYSARRFFENVALSIEQRGAGIGVFLVNDTAPLVQGELAWSLETLAGERVDQGVQAVAVLPNCAEKIVVFDFTAQLKGDPNLVFVAEFRPNEQPGSFQRSIALFKPEKELVLPDPRLAVEFQAGLQDELHLTVRAQALARFVHLDLPGQTVTFSDNYFDLPAGRELEVSCELPDGMSSEEARQKLSVRSLYGIDPASSPLAETWQRFKAAARPVNLFSKIIYRLIE